MAAKPSFDIGDKTKVRSPPARPPRPPRPPPARAPALLALLLLGRWIQKLPDKGVQRPGRPAPPRTGAAADRPAPPFGRPQVRVWWPPTSAQGAAEFSGMFWPAETAGKSEKGQVDLKYDNNAIRKAELVHLQPPEGDVPVKFGKEVEPLVAGEFCEVFNNSKQDPGSWVVKIKKLLPDGKYVCKSPFHDTAPEPYAQGLLRRLRIHKNGGWHCLDPSQVWKDGAVSSPMEMKTIAEAALMAMIGKKAAPNGAAPAPAAPPALAAAKKRKALEPAEATTSGAGKPVRTRKKRKPKRDPNKPKRPKNSYLIFLERHRSILREKHPEKGIKEITSMLAEQWKTVSAAEKASCEAEAEKLRLSYATDMKAYKESLPPSAALLAKGGRKGRLKKPRSAWILFLQEGHEKAAASADKGERLQEVAPRMGKLWQSMSDEDKEPYVKRAEEERAKYLVLKKEYDEKVAEELEARPPALATVVAPAPSGTGQLSLSPRAAPAAAPSPAVPSSRDVTAHIDEIKKKIKSKYIEDAFYMVVDYLRPGTEHCDRTAKAAFTFIVDTKRSDVKAFMVHTFGLAKAKELEKAEK